LSTCGKRRRCTAEQKRKIVAEGMEPDVSAAMVAGRHGISTGQFYAWPQRLLRRGALDAGADSTTIAATVPPRRCFASSYTVPRNAERPLRRDLPESARLHWSADGWETRTDAQTRDTGLGILNGAYADRGFRAGSGCRVHLDEPGRRQVDWQRLLSDDRRSLTARHAAGID
jgi:transposase-like protein